eukprot:1077810-Amphidinium_carterae.2
MWAAPESRTRVSVKSDSLSACTAFVKNAARSPMLEVLTRELAIDLALERYLVDQVTHIPGVSNVQPDALSRLYAPQPKAVPGCLLRVRRVNPPPRDQEFWVSLCLEVEKKGPWVARSLAVAF